MANIGFFSDIHGNADALIAVLSAEQSNTIWYCLGDLVGYGDQPNQACEIVRSRNIHAILGNHDAMAIGLLPVRADRDEVYRGTWTRQALSQSNLDWLSSLPQSHTLHAGTARIELRHASPWDLTTYLFKDALRLSEAIPTDGSTLVIGHTHHGFIVETPQGTIINCGSVGQPRSGLAGAHYALRSESGAWQLKVAKYDISATVDRMSRSGVPQAFYSRLVNPNDKLE